MQDICGTVQDMNATERPDRAKARIRQELRRSNAARPIPAAKHKRPRSRTKQDLRQEARNGQ